MNKKAIFIGGALTLAFAVMISMYESPIKQSTALTLANIHALTNYEVQKVQGFEERVETTEENWDYENWTYSAKTKIDCKGKGETKCP